MASASASAWASALCADVAVGHAVDVDDTYAVVVDPLVVSDVAASMLSSFYQPTDRFQPSTKRGSAQSLPACSCTDTRLP